MPRPIYSDAQVSISVDDATGLVRYVRSRQPYSTLEHLREVNAKLAAALGELRAGPLYLLIDSREAPPRNDEAFEAEINRFLVKWMPRFSAHAILVKTAVGRLQATRVARSRGADASVFTDEAAALAYLAEPRR